MKNLLRETEWDISTTIKFATEKTNQAIMQLQLIQSKIYELRGLRVMLDFDLAELYQVETRVLNQSVKRNSDRFPSDFRFQITKEEWDLMSSQIVMTYPNKRPKVSLPFAFTEQGVAMLSGILNSKRAIEVNISIMRAFVSIRQLSLSNTELRNAIEKLAKQTNNNTKNIELVFQYLDELMEKNEKPTKRNRVGYKHYD
jgi:hypothetical protein